MKIERIIRNINEGFKIAWKITATKQIQPSLSVVLVDFKVPIAEGAISKISYGFYKLQKKLFRKKNINVVWVKIDNAASEAKIMSFGDYSYEQAQQITDFVGSKEFPPPALDLAQVILQPRDIVRLIMEHQISNSINPTELGDVEANLHMNKNKPVWEIQQEISQVGYRRIAIDAQNGEIVSEKTDWLYGVER